MTLGGGEVAALLALGVFAGWLGSVVGIGGGVIIVPTLVLAFGFATTEAVAVSLVGVTANSVAASSTYARNGLAHKRLALTLEIATTLGGLTGGVVAGILSRRMLNGIFAGVMLVTAGLMTRGKGEESVDAGPESGNDEVPWESPGTLNGAYLGPDGQLRTYAPQRLPLGGAVSYLAGLLSGLLGVGGGFLKVPAMALGMRVPVRVAAATSNFMIGVTAVSSLLVYLVRGDVRPYLAAPVAIGIVAGALVGSHTAGRLSVGGLRRLFAVVIVGVAVLMGMKAAGVLL